MKKRGIKLQKFEIGLLTTSPPQSKPYLYLDEVMKFGSFPNWRIYRDTLLQPLKQLHVPLYIERNCHIHSNGYAHHYQNLWRDFAIATSYILCCRHAHGDTQTIIGFICMHQNLIVCCKWTLKRQNDILKLSLLFGFYMIMLEMYLALHGMSCGLLYRDKKHGLVWFGTCLALCSIAYL